MTTLPVKLITDLDQPLFGTNLFNLAKLERLGFPVVSGIAVCAPEIVLKTVLKHIQLQNKEIFEQKLSIVKADLHKIKIPEDLEKLLKKEKLFYLNEQLYVSKKVVWETLLDIWLQEIRAKFWKFGFTSGIAQNLTPQSIFFTEKQYKQAVAFFEPSIEDVVIKCDIKLSPEVAHKIDELVIEANRKLFLPQNYHLLIIGKKVRIIAVLPFTQTLPASQTAQIIMPKVKQEKVIKSATKVFLNISSGFALANQTDGILIEGEKMINFDEAVLKLSEAALILHPCPVIYKMPDIFFSGIRGSLHLIHQKNLLDEVAEIFLFVRNKKGFSNVELAIPLTRSIDELMQIKRELAAREISRKGSLKIWWEVSVPENLINLEDYLEAGVDGVILNLDTLNKNLSGFGLEELWKEGAHEPYRKQIQALTKFIEPAFVILHKAKVPILVNGELAIGSDMLNFLLKKGVWGIVANSAVEAENLPEYFAWTEKRIVYNSVYES